MHVGIAYLRWRGKRSRHSRRMRNRNFAYLARSPLPSVLQYLGKMYSSCILGEGENLNNTHLPRDSQASCQLVPHFIINKHTHLFEINNPKNQSFFNSWSKYSMRFLEPSVAISSLIPKQNVPYRNVFLKQCILHPILRCRYSQILTCTIWHFGQLSKFWMSHDANKNYQ